MNYLVAYVAGTVGILAGVALGILVGRDTIRVLEEQIKHLRTEVAVATDRLVHAWKEGATIPPRPLEAPLPLPVLASELQAEIDQWEDPTHRAEIEAEIRARMGRGEAAPAILLALDNHHP